MSFSNDILVCPLCASPLHREGRSLVCVGGARRHTYDVAKEGYVNLLPPGKGKNAHTGDEAAMVRARSEFLGTDAYGRLSDEVARLILENVQSDDVTVIDSGCGEGYHTCRFTSAVRDAGRRVYTAAFDASKHAAAAGAKRAVRSALSAKDGVYADFNGDAVCAFMAGNIFSLPVAESAADAVVSMFAPIAWEENRRVLKDGGILVVAASGEDHLLEMRQVIYEEVIKKAPEVVPAEGFEEISRSSVRYTHDLSSSAEIMNLFGMTPFCYKTPREAVERLSAKESLSVTVHTDYFVFRCKK
ncbi:MAG: methyltransferase domain-containing protein [Clostridia bacterium]|nr:methyltransferase domain-containing protein [Clostridia bacterium]